MTTTRNSVDVLLVIPTHSCDQHNKDKYVFEKCTGIHTSCPYYSYCDFNRKDCPTDVEYIVLTQIQDDQCSDGHGGTLCMNCANHKTFTYLALKWIVSHGTLTCCLY